MSGTIKGIIVEIGGDTSGLQKSLSKVNSQSSSLSKELKGINSLLKLDPKNVELLEQKQTVLNESIEITQDKLNQLKKVKEEADKKMAEGTEISKENYRNLQREIINTERKLGNLTEEMKQLNLANSNWTKAGKKIEEYGSKITKVSDKINDIGNKASIVSGAVIAGGTVLTNSAMNVEDAVAKYVNSTNTAQEETEKYKKVLEDISRNNYGESYEDIADAMSQVKVQLKDVNSQDLKNITEKAIALRDLFGYDVSESIRAVKSMMDNFNISADEAFNLIAEGKKQGLDFSNELIDSVNEYSVQFKKLGLTADDMFNIFKSGAENGAFNLDKIGDAVKEFSIRAIDGSNTTVEGFKKIGLNADKMAKKFSKGGDEAKEAFKEVIQRISKMDNKVEQSIVGVDLFGTMWEDLGPTVITSFSKMDRGISKSSNSMQKSIDGLYNTTKKKAEAQLKRLQALGANFGEEMLPILEKLIDKAEGFISCIEGMSDAEKENLIHVGLLVAGIGPLTKVVGTTGQAIGNVTKRIGTFSQAIGVMKNDTESGVASVDNLAKMLTGITSPTGLATIGITALAGTIVYLATKETEAQEKAREFADEIKNTKQSFDEYNQKVDKTTQANLNEINSVNKLKEELFKLVDANGKVKSGYEGRVSFILNQLNNALGTEYKLNDNIVQSYKDLQLEIEGTIKKKKAEVILNSQQEKFANAKDNETEAINNLKIATENLTKVKEDYGMSLEELRKKAEGSLGKEKEYLENIINAYDDATQTVKNNTEIQKQYAEDYELFINGKYDEIGKSITNSTTNWTNTSLETIRTSIIEQAKSLETYKSIYETTGNEVAETQMKQAKQNLKNLADELSSRTSTISTMSAGEITAWNTLARESYETYRDEINKMPEETKQKIQKMTRVVTSDTTLPNAISGLANKTTGYFQQLLNMDRVTANKLSNVSGIINKNKTVEQESGNLGTRTKVMFEKNINSASGKTAMTDYIQGAENGANQKKGSFWNLIFGIGRKANQQMRDGLGDGSPSVLAKRALIDYFLGADIGIDKQAPKTLKNIAEYSSKINKEFIENMKIPEVKDFGKLQRKLSSQLIDAQKTVFTTPEITFNVQELDEAKLQQCFNYVNKKFGSQY